LSGSIFGGARIAGERISQLRIPPFSVEVLYLTAPRPSKGISDLVAGMLRYRVAKKILGWNGVLGILPFFRTRALLGLTGSPDLINFHALNGSGVTVSVVRELSKRLPTVWTVHDAGWVNAIELFNTVVTNDSRSRVIFPLARAIQSAILKQRLRYSLKRVTLVVPSNWLKSRLVNVLSLPTDQVAVIPNPIPASFFDFRVAQDQCRKDLGLPENSPIIGFAAWKAWKTSGNQNKGYGEIGQAIRGLRSSHDFTFVVFGHDGQHVPDDLQAVWIAPDATEEQVKRFYRSVDVIVGASKEENLPTVMQEAQAIGTPCVAPRATGYLEAIEDQHTGLLYQPGNPADLAKKIAKLLDDSDMAHSFGSHGKERAGRLWAEDVVGKRYLEVYQDAVGRFRA